MTPPDGGPHAARVGHQPTAPGDEQERRGNRRRRHARRANSTTERWAPPHAARARHSRRPSKPPPPPGAVGHRPPEMGLRSDSQGLTAEATCAAAGEAPRRGLELLGLQKQKTVALTIGRSFAKVESKDGYIEPSTTRSRWNPGTSSSSARNPGDDAKTQAEAWIL